MKPKLHILAATLLLAAAPALADDLLDAVLWDGPSAFPAESTQTPEPVPAFEPAPQPFPEPFGAGPAPQPAPEASAPVPGETQIRREIEEMRAQADRLEAELQQSGNSRTPAPGPGAKADSAYPTPSFVLSARGGAGAENERAFAGELGFRLGKLPFDIAFRGFYLEMQENRTDSYEETYYTYTTSYTRRHGWNTYEHRHSRTVYYDYKVTEFRLGAEATVVWRPFRGKPFSPYAGAGGRIARFELTEDDNFRGDESEFGPETEFSPVGRIGLDLYVPHLEFLTLKGEFIAAKECNEIVGEVGLRLGRHFALNAFAESFDMELGRGTAFGGGMTLLF